MNKTGILLVNLGTPSEPHPKQVRAFLNAFLSDPRVIDLPWVLRKALLHGLILPFRTPKTTQAYQQIWQPEGSPLLVFSKALQQSLQAALVGQAEVILAMRYGSPSLKQVLPEMAREYNKILILPLYPQYASSTTGSVLEDCYDILKPLWNSPTLEFIEPFYDKPWFIEALQARAEPYLESLKPDHVLMSFHGLPIRHLEKSGCGKCPPSEQCPSVRAEQAYCYRAQCYATAKALSYCLNRSEQNYSVAFQSRLGRLPWIQPYIDEHLVALYKKGVRRLSVICPSFTTDCLETLEEIGIRLRLQWEQLGGEAFGLIPCLNDHPVWVNALVKLVQHKTSPTIKRDSKVYTHYQAD